MIIFSVLISFAAILPGAFETRFAVLYYMTMIPFIFMLDYKKFLCGLKSNGESNLKFTVKILLIFIIFASVAVALESEILNSLEGYPLIFKGK